MAIQKLQQSRALSVTPSDNGGIYAPWAPVITAATATTTSATFIVATGVDFSNVDVGDIVVSTGSGGSGVTSVITQVDTVNDRILCTPTGFTDTEFSIFKPMSGLIYVGGAGDLAVVTDGGDEVTFSAVPAGSFLPVHIKQVKLTGTDATAILALW
jgi:hypothetical protein